MRPAIFISYRREDAAGDAGRLADLLQSTFRHARVFLDVEAIAPGADFTQVLASYLKHTAAVLVVIGSRWVSLRSEHGERRLDDPKDFVRFEIEAALARDVPVIPVLVQGAAMPRAEDLPPSLAPLALRQAATLDHSEFHADVERLCQSLAPFVQQKSFLGRHAARWLAVAAVAAVLIGVVVRKVIAPTAGPAGVSSSAHAPPPQGDDQTPAAVAPEPARTADKDEGKGVDTTVGTRPAVGPGVVVDALLAEAGRQRRRNQLADALATLARARGLAPRSGRVLEAEEEVAMQWIREAHVVNGQSSFGEAIKPALVVVDAALTSARGTRRADLLAHEGWATFLLWRDGDRRLDPSKEYREALAVDPKNPYANAMLAHWLLGHSQDLAGALKHFDLAAGSNRDLEAVRTLQWSAYQNADTPETKAERVRVADAMRRGAEKLTGRQANDFWSIYYFALLGSHSVERRLVLDALPPDEHIRTLNWAIEQNPAQHESRRDMLRYYLAALNAKAGRVAPAREELRALDKKLAPSPGSLQDAVRAELKRL